MRESTNKFGSEDKIIHKELSFLVNGLLFKVHNELGRFCREKQYGDAFEKLLKNERVRYVREKELSVETIDNSRSNIVDFEIEGKILVDLKAKPVIRKDDYYQMQRYLQAGNYKLGLVINFRNQYLKPIRVIRIIRMNS
ncbi:MAG: hypothetical protein UV64_C0017G0010 [Parcubacteria group bacterium GW2011_GWC1_43_11b]|uniref:GxxExxY protein n=2 Tax=Candidatus Vogeliibacteriota TaxID=1817922 RepID=A0A1G2QBS0_9BACT|nr:MAG: hypothetical protein UV50_C0019G0005 [Parcubacteria group bacterium GW2011_GWB1_42_9]KKS88835.1 MAG: hypothetical protein UV64_C0017G0010 [Parcubacteria group bacterium GW2011_GWC1_43_11b]KKT09177.1 MAG: hypothetical protein UV88_C0015G0004 [Parcubacteria group bacterium GW2011_GWA1_43_21]OHA58026.1 MAG: hypothetical protein A2370_01230 [Candidatus Vogelbacteria bacterium RIFOXYB1_FULL_42_16]OHA58385.1 MAG: hypothetical protein A2607_01325 [Candidatus Vogelbacteria bacterium RIFOXYD1_FU